MGDTIEWSKYIFACMERKCYSAKKKKKDGKLYHAEMKKTTQGIWKKWCFLLPFLFACFSNLALKIMLMLLVLSSNCKIVGLLCWIICKQCIKVHETSLGIETENIHRHKIVKEIQLNQIEGRYQGTNCVFLQCGIAYKTPEQLWSVQIMPSRGRKKTTK